MTVHRNIFAGIAALLLSAASYAGPWTYKTDTDPMNSTQTQTAYVKSDNSLNLSFPYAGPNYGSLVIRSRKTDGLNVIVTVDKGQIMCDTFNGCSIKVRFDEAQPTSFHAIGPSDHASTALFLQPESRFVEQAKKAKRILVELTMYQSGQQVLTFTSTDPLVWASSPKAAPKPATTAPATTAPATTAPATTMTQVERMMACNKGAGTLTGDARRSFMSDCLKNGGPAAK